MGRKSVNKLRQDECRDAIWAVIREVKGDFSVRDIYRETCLGRDTVRDYLTGLTKAGYLSITTPFGGGPMQPTRYTLVKDVGVDAPRVRPDGSEVTQGKGRLQMWNTLRVLRDFSPRDLAFNASTDEHPVDEIDAKCYVRYLHAAGYLTLVRKSTVTSQARYRLIPTKWTGPKPPQVQRVRQVYDPNIREVVWTGQDAVQDGGRQ